MVRRKSTHCSIVDRLDSHLRGHMTIPGGPDIRPLITTPSEDILGDFKKAQMRKGSYMPGMIILKLYM